MFERFTFRHGVHPPEHKELTAQAGIRRLPFPKEVVLPLQQHAGKPARAIVRPGDRVERGDLIAEADGWISSPVHASASGTVSGIGLAPHPDGTWKTAIRIAVEPFSAQVPRPRMVPAWEGLDPKALVEAIRHAGVVGLGGAAFPTHVKLSPPPEKPVELILINGCECEPYLTTDHRTMAEFPGRVHLGIRIMMRCLGVTRAVIGVERNKPDAIEALERTRPSDLRCQRPPAHGEIPSGRREDADRGGHRAGSPFGQASARRRRDRPERRPPPPPSPRCSRPACRWWSGSSPSPDSACGSRPT